MEWLKTFRAKHGTVFRYREDLIGELYIQVSGESAEGVAVVKTSAEKKIATVQIPMEDLMQFAAHAADSVPLATDEYDTETGSLILEHINLCSNCRASTNDCREFCELIIERSRARPSGRVQ